MQNWQLDDLISGQSNNIKLINGLKLIQPRPTTGSLAIYDSFDFAKLYWFMQNFHHNIDCNITGSEQFPGKMLTPRKKRVSLPDNIYNLLVKYYNNAYDDWKFVSIADSLLDESKSIVILPNIDQFGRIRIATEIFV
jgi:hypothetical protein